MEPYDHSKRLRPDASNPKQREIVEFLRAQNLPGVDTDDNAAVELEVEQARLVLVGSGAVIGFGITQILSLRMAVCVEPLYAGFIFLIAALCLSWFALIGSASFRLHRVRRRIEIFHMERDEYLEAIATNRPTDPQAVRDRIDGRVGAENIVRNKLQNLRITVTICMGLGLSLALFGAVATRTPSLCLWAPSPAPPLQDAVPAGPAAMK